MQAEARDEAKEGLKRDALESREALGLVVGGGDSDADEEEGEGGMEGEVVPPQILKERIESVIEVLSDFQVGIVFMVLKIVSSYQQAVDLFAFSSKHQFFPCS